MLIAMKKGAKITLISLGVVVLLIIAMTVWVKTRPAPLPRTYTAKRQNVVQEVAFTGHLKSQQSVNLAFDFSGKVLEMPVSVGDKVAPGQLLARLDARLSQLDLAQAQATLASTSGEAKVALDNAASGYNQTKSVNAKTVAAQRQAVIDAKAALDQKKDIYQQVVRENSDQSSITKNAQATVLAAESGYNGARAALDESLKTAAKTNDAALGASNLAQAQYQATLQAAPGQAGLSALGAVKAKAAVTLSKSTLTAPFASTVVARNVDPNEFVAAGSPVFILETTDALEVSADVPETDAAKLSVGQTATITLDALPSGEAWQATVTDIAPAAKMIEGVPTFEVKLRLAMTDTKLKPGLTANVTVHAAQQDDVIAVPRRSIITRSGKQTVQVLDAQGKTQDREVVVGLVGTDGLAEITSGLTAGDAVVLGVLASPNP